MLDDFTTRPELSGTLGAVVSTHWLASGAAMAVLEKGGNAFDAAAAAGFVLQVVEPHQNGPGGEVPLVLKSAGEDNPVVICGQGVAPAAATYERFCDLGLKMVPGTGLLPAVVPGAFGAWMLMLRDFGTLSLRDVLSYAINYAENGFPLFHRVVATILPVRRRFLNDWPSSGDIWLPGGRAPEPNRLFRLPALAATYRQILAEAEAASSDRIAQMEAARKAFYQGFVADAIDDFYSKSELPDALGRLYPGLLRGDDLARWSATREPTASYDYKGFRVHKPGPWSQGPVCLQELALLSGFDLDAMEPCGSEFIHTAIECAKLALADREVHYGDPNESEVPLDVLLSDDYCTRRRRDIGDTASRELRPGALGNAAARLASVIDQAGRDNPPGIDCGEPVYQELPSEPADTVHLDVADRHGNMVSATPSGGWLQGSPAVPGLGFCISTRGQMFWLDQGLPSSLRPRMRPRTTLSPTLVTRDGEPCIAYGAPGGDQQGQWPLFAFLRHIHGGMTMQQAIDAPNFHCLHFASSFYPREMCLGRLCVEDRMPVEVIEELRERGHDVVIESSWALGRVCMVARDRELLRAAASPRQVQAYALCR